MNLALDIGNTRIKAGLFGKKEKPRETLFVLPEELFLLLQRDDVDRTIACHTGKMPLALTEHAANGGRGKVHVLSHSSKLPLALDYDTPDTLGMDRVAAACAAEAMFHGKPILVIDAGTCITIDFVDANAHYKGGAILPGLRMRFRALHDYTAALPLVEFDPEKDAATMQSGRNTTDSMKAGVIAATCYEILGFMGTFLGKFPNLEVALTGGDARFLRSYARLGCYMDEHLVLKGLNRILLMNET
ncbi:MAG: type III pantothenate kinase [Bacteroidales bacterium]|nr:type III pantothenate kinase [Bacteroidales bacterium]